MNDEPQLDYLMEKKVQLLLDMSNKKFEQKLTQMQKQLDDAHSQIDTLKTNVKNLRAEQVSQPQFNQQPSQQAPQPQAQPAQGEQSISQQFAQFQQQNQGQQTAQPAQAQQAPAQPQQTTTSEKCGGYTSEDVSVEKFFYAGKR